MKFKQVYLGWGIIGVAAVCLALGCCGLDDHDPAVDAMVAKGKPALGPSIAWGYSLDDALKIAQTTGKPVMLDFFATWCGPCKLMDEYTYSTPDVVKASWSVVPVRIDMDEKPDLARKYMVRVIPTAIFLTSKGKIVSRMAGVLPPEGMLQRMEEAIVAEANSTEK